MIDTFQRDFFCEISHNFAIICSFNKAQVDYIRKCSISEKKTLLRNIQNQNRF